MEKYILGQSEMREINEQSPEIRIDLYLKENIYYDNALIYGRVRDNKRSPIEEAKVKFIDINGQELGYVYSSEDGYYTYNGVKLNKKIRIEAQKSGYQDHRSCYIDVKSRRIIYNIVLEENITHKTTLITGHVYNEDGKPLEYITIVLSKFDSKENEKVYTYTCSNEYGQFVFSKITKGKYKITINESKYYPLSKVVDIVDIKDFHRIDLKLKRRANKTKIAGNILDDEGNPIKDALVILYRVEENEEFIPIDFRLTDEFGKYEFEDIPYGNYVVKAVY